MALVSNKAAFSLAAISLFSIAFANPVATTQDRLPASDDTLTPPTNKPTTLKSSLTILTEADITHCRPFPNTALHPQVGTTYGPGTTLKLTCWTYNDIPGTEAGESEPWDIWVKTGSYGCFINENDLKSWNIDFEETLGYCAHPGPNKLAGNRPVGAGDPSLVPPPVSPLPATPDTPDTPTPVLLPTPKSELKPLPTLLPAANTSHPQTYPAPPKPDNSTKIGIKRRVGVSRRLF